MEFRRPIAFLFLSLAALPLAAQKPALFGNAVLLPGSLGPAHERLLARKWKEARDLAQQEVPGLAGDFDTDPAPAAAALALLALAEAGAGERETALCHWNVAKNLNARLGEADLTLYGEPGAFLRNAQAPEPSEEERKLLERAKAENTKVIRPELLEWRKKPAYTDAARAANIEGIVILESILGVDGRISQVRTLQNLPKGLGLQAMEAICHWRFKPARIGQQPVKVYYNLTVNFKRPQPSESQNP